MKKTIILTALMLTASFAFADVNRGTIGQGLYYSWTGEEIACYGIDFDNDGYLEIAIKDGWDYMGSEVTLGYIEYAYNGVQIVSISPERWDCFQLLNYGDVIPNYDSQNILGEGDAMFYDINEVSTTASYIGFEIVGIDCNWWAYVKIHREGSTIVWDEAYISNPIDAPITVGAGETQGINPIRPESAAPACTKIMKDGRIYIQRDGRTYDLSGRCVEDL